ncbi:MAG: hypothetical protein LBU89_04460 [Fibromonadaceae bacterium]|jgi:hypothetical protein|nr:hypothetical protein [Fibromonadaceae bacterium]
MVSLVAATFFLALFILYVWMGSRPSSARRSSCKLPLLHILVNSSGPYKLPDLSDSREFIKKKENIEALNRIQNKRDDELCHII